MKLNEIYKIADEIAPKRLSEEYCAAYEGYDNSGILVDTGKEIEKILFSLDFSLEAIERASEEGANLIVTHHPAIYGKIGNIRADNFDPLSKKLLKAIEKGISVISMHLNLDMAQGGVDESLKNGVIAAAKNASGKTSVKEETTEKTMWQVTGGGYGRAYDLPAVKLGKLVEEIKKEFTTTRIFTYGDKEQTVTRAASFCGGGGDTQEVEYAVKNGAQVIVSSDFKHHALLLAKESGLAVVQMTHYASENYGFKKYYEKIRSQTGIPCVYHTDEGLL
ncbi:MAG: Nif3-like dinuclear metal center hexameric protein [Clostridia bacterium]|nr:Nif3-like dinuclear metal center hexameric protein [Clostridia bacterium]